MHLLFLEGLHEQVAGNHQKHFNAEVAVGEMLRIEVEKDDQNNREASE